MSSSPKQPETLTHWPLFVACAPGLEPMLLEEIEALDVPRSEPKQVSGGVELLGDFSALYRLNLELGLALKVLLRVGEFGAKRFDQLVRKTSQLPWELFAGPGAHLDVKATCKRSRLYHSSAVVERVLDGISQRLKREVPIADDATEASGTPVLKVLVRILDDQCVLSVDSSGELLSRRGYRLATAKAPMREDLARALVLSSGWDPNTPLIDPFAGAGTLAIEADWIARRVPPGFMRSFAFQVMPFFQERVFSTLRARALRQVSQESPSIFASDRDAGAIVAAKANAERAQSKAPVFEQVSLSEARWFSHTWFAEQLATRGAVVTNPPYGLRIGKDAQLERLYRAFGEAVRKLPAGFNVAMAVAFPEHAFATGLDLKPALMTDHGGSKIYFSVRR